jgi:hypothetical protein
MDKPSPSPRVAFDLPWAMILLELDPAESGVFRRGDLREDLQEWLNQHMPARYRIEGGVFTTKASVIKTRHFRISFDLERDAVFFRLRWGEEIRLPRPGECFSVHIVALPD